MLISDPAAKASEWAREGKKGYKSDRGERARKRGGTYLWWARRLPLA